MTDETTAQRRALGRHRLGATALLVAMGLVFAVASASGLSGFWIDLVRAGSEAALVGGLADWFAVTALFRRPLGLPIPHTAVIPNSKERIGNGLGTFIERNILEPELVLAHLRAAGVSRRLGTWLSVRGNAEMVSGRLVVILGFVFRSLNDQKLQRQAQLLLRRKLREAEFAPAMATLVEVLRRSGTHHDLFDYLLTAMREYIAGRQDSIAELVEKRSEWWVPRRVDRRVAAAITKGLIAYLDDLGNRDHEARRSLDESIERLIRDLRESPEWRRRIASLRDEVLDAPQVASYFDALWKGLREALEGDLGSPTSRLQQTLSGLLRAIGATLADDREVQARMDRRIEAVVQDLVVPWRRDIGAFVAGVVRGWETRTIVDRIELAVGKDLQYIRINGTLVGAVVGCAIFLVVDVLL